MESRNITLTTSGERCTLSPQDRKAVNDIENFIELTGVNTSVSYPLYELIPEIIAMPTWKGHLSVLWQICEMQTPK